MQSTKSSYTQISLREIDDVVVLNLNIWNEKQLPNSIKKTKKLEMLVWISTPNLCKPTCVYFCFIFIFSDAKGSRCIEKFIEMTFAIFIKIIAQHLGQSSSWRQHQLPGFAHTHKNFLANRERAAEGWTAVLLSSRNVRIQTLLLVKY